MADVPSYGILCGTFQPKEILDFLKMSNLAFSLINICVVYSFIKNIWNSFTFNFLFCFQQYIATKNPQFHICLFDQFLDVLRTMYIGIGSHETMTIKIDKFVFLQVWYIYLITTSYNFPLMIATHPQHWRDKYEAHVGITIATNI